MADWAHFVVVPRDGEFELYESRFGAVGIDLDLLAGPGETLAMVRGLTASSRWLDDVHCEGGAVIDLGRRVLLLFAWEGPITEMPRRAATWELLREAWAGWEVRWGFDGPADLRVYLGLDPEPVRYRSGRLHVALPMDVDEEELGDESLLAVVTIGADRCHVVADIGDLPICEGPAVVERLADAPEHGVSRVAADAGIHVDPERRYVGWWTLRAQAQAHEMAERWPGWTVEFWRDGWEEHVRVAGGRFLPPAVDPEAARAQVRERWRERRERLAQWAIARARG